MRKMIIILNTVSLLVLTSCAENPISFISWMTSHSTIPQSNIEKVQEKLTKVKAAVNAGDFVMARKEFSKVETTWKMEVPVRDRSDNHYTAVEIYMDEVKQTLYSKPLSREKAILSLHSLEKILRMLLHPEILFEK